MHIEKILPSITLWKIDKDISFPEVRQGTINRQFLDDTHNSHGYHCPPVTSSNVSGWEFLLPQDVVVIWDGISDSDPDHIKIISGEFLENKKIVETVTGNATIRFMSNIIIETDENHFSILSGAPNYFIDGAESYNVVLRTDHHNYSESFIGWRITRPNQEILFPKGMPFMFLRNYPKTLLQDTSIFLKNLTDSQSKMKETSEYSKMMKDFYDNKKGWQFSGWYKKGISPNHPNGKELTIRPVLKNP